MTLFRLLLAAIWIVLVAYTAAVIARHGWNLLPIFFGDMLTMGWPGQFNLDFMFMLTLSALWVLWRHEFSAAGIGLAGLALIGGSLFLSTYLLIQSFRVGGAVELLIGRRAAQ